MFFHVTATHTADNCPIYDPELQIAAQESMSTLEKLATDVGLTVHFQVTGAPDHSIFFLLETDDFSAVQRFMAAIPIKQEFSIVPVTPVKLTIETLLGRQQATSS